MNTTATPTTLPEIVADILKDIEDPFKTTLMNTEEDDLIALHPGWARVFETSMTFGMIVHS